MAEANISTGKLQCVIVTPEATVLDTRADFVTVPLFDGEVGIAPRHSPLIGRLGFGELRIKRDGAVERLYVDGGFVQVADDVVSVLTNRAVAASSLDPEAAEEQLRTVLAQRASGSDELAIRERRISQARGQLRVARRPA